MKKRISRWLRELADKLDPHHEHAHITPGCMVNIHNASPFYPNVTVGSEALEDRPDALSKVHQAQYRAARAGKEAGEAFVCVLEQSDAQCSHMLCKPTWVTNILNGVAGASPALPSN